MVFSLRLSHNHQLVSRFVHLLNLHSNLLPVVEIGRQTFLWKSILPVFLRHCFRPGHCLWQYRCFQCLGIQKENAPMLSVKRHREKDNCVLSTQPDIMQCGTANQSVLQTHTAPFLFLCNRIRRIYQNLLHPYGTYQLFPCNEHIVEYH